MENKTVFVSAGIIYKGSKLLITQRKSTSRLAANLWEFPGGKIEYLEDPKETLVREIKEELDISIKVAELFDVVSHVYYENKNEKIHIVMVLYICEWLAKSVQNIECQDSKWVTVDELKNFVFADADIPVVNKLLSRMK